MTNNLYIFLYLFLDYFFLFDNFLNKFLLADIVCWVLLYVRRTLYVQVIIGIIGIIGTYNSSTRGTTTGNAILDMHIVYTLFTPPLLSPFTGLVLRLPVFAQPDKSTAFHDEEWWETPDDYSLTGSAARHEKLGHTNGDHMMVTNGNSNTDI